jgi:hypothetical protein
MKRNKKENMIKIRKTVRETKRGTQEQKERKKFKRLETNEYLKQCYRVVSAQADWTLTHTSHKDTEQSTIEVFVTLDCVTLTDLHIR